jgi:peptide/nickel transport system permease protein
MFDAVSNRDYPLIQGCFLVLSLLVIAANLCAELAYRRLDPRVRPA